MSRIGRQLGYELAESDRQMRELNASLERDAARERLAIADARSRYQSDDVDVLDEAESVDGGYWVRARLWVSADDVVLDGEEDPIT